MLLFFLTLRFVIFLFVGVNHRSSATCPNDNLTESDRAREAFRRSDIEKFLDVLPRSGGQRARLLSL